MTSPRKTRVAVVFGGRAGEHAAADAILGALDPGEFDVVPLEIRPDHTGRNGIALDPITGLNAFEGVDVVFPVMRGSGGEDGIIQGLLEMAGIPYVGANVFAAAVALDRALTRRLAAADGVPVVPCAVLRPNATLSGAERERLGLPVRVTPPTGGGVTVEDWAELDAAVAHARTIGPKVVVEAVIAGRQVACGVLDGEPQGLLPDDLPEPVARQVRAYARAAFTAIDCTGFARIDVVVTPESDVYLSGIDTTPALVPEPALLGRLVRAALSRGSGLH